MLFNSFDFVIFLLVVYALYLPLLNRIAMQNVLLLIAGYVFYGFWDWRFLSLLMISTIFDYSIGRLLDAIEDVTPAGRRKRKALLICSVIINLSFLGLFKYFNFFSENAVLLLNASGFKVDDITLKIVLPVGISFYTFVSMSYIIDIYRKKQVATKNLLNYAAFVAFFPQLMAGPIERAKNLLTQIERPRAITSDQINAGLFLILWGYFKKVVVADNCGMIASEIFNNYQAYRGIDLLIGGLSFTMQIYGDFSGYSDIARGIARLFGFELMINFRLPYFSVSPSDFWRRWHISLSTWLRDYLYIPLGGNREGTIRTCRNVFLTMVLGGLWHGAAWNYIIWGAYHGFLLIMYRIVDGTESVGSEARSRGPRLVLLGRMMLMFSFTVIGWIIFRSTSIAQITHMFANMSFASSEKSSDFAYELMFFSLPILLIQVYQYVKNDLLALAKLPMSRRTPLYSFLLLWILIFGVRESTEFIYFQF